MVLPTLPMPSLPILPLALLLALPPPTAALIDPPASPLTQNAFVHPSVEGATEFLSFDEAFGDASSDGGDWGIALASYASDPSAPKVDARSGRMAGIDLNIPLFPGDNALLWRVDADASDDPDGGGDGDGSFPRGTRSIQPFQQRDEDAERVRTQIAALAKSGLQHRLSELASLLNIDEGELFEEEARVAVHGSSVGAVVEPGRGGRRLASAARSSLVQLSLPRSHKSVPVPSSRAFAVVKDGNLVRFGLEKWGDVVDGNGEELDVVPRLTAEEAGAILEGWAGVPLAEGPGGARGGSGGGSIREGRDGKPIPDPVGGTESDLCEPRLQILTLDDDGGGGKGERGRRRLDGKTAKRHSTQTGIVDATSASDSAEEPSFAIGQGYVHALVWRICPKFRNQKQEIMEGLVDAHTGRVYSFVDTVDYFSGSGAVYPVSNDGKGADGLLAEGWPVPHALVSDGGGGAAAVTSSGGNHWSLGNKTTSLEGTYVVTRDACGPSRLEFSGSFDWGGTNGTDCDTPGFGGGGNTQASRSGYYELNRITEIARGQLPGNAWLRKRLVANMNINQSCNAFWNGEVNFYRRHPNGACANTGEIAGVFDHEWGHGLDANDVNPGIVKPSGEGIADIYTALRLGSSCIGRGFFKNPCGQFGDKCTNGCTGVRDIDFANHQSGKPHDLTWTNTKCVGNNDNVHCKGLVYSEAIWSLWKRDLPTFYGYDDNTALEIVVRLTYIAAGNVETWYSGSPPYGGCGGNSGYLSYLLADDDDGNITNGTPHMQAIFSAHHRQQIACDTPEVQDSGCLGKPTEAPNVTVVPGSMENIVTWTAVTNAVNYQVFRTEGVYECSQGKVLLATLASSILSFTDKGLMNGRKYYYIVIPKGSDDACFGPASQCVESSPSTGPGYHYNCPSEIAVLDKGQKSISVIHLCTLFAVSGFTGTVSLSCDASSMTGVSCKAPSSITFSPGDEYKSVQILVNGTNSTPIGDGKVVTSATVGTTTRDADISVAVATSGGDQMALYDAVLHVPNCYVPGVKCSSGNLLDGRGSSELNSPNTLDDCYDGDWGKYHVHTSIDEIVVRSGRKGAQNSTLQLTEHSYATISATVWSFSNDTADFYYTSTPLNPDWIYIGSKQSTVQKGKEMLEVDFKLPSGAKQAVRVNLRYKGSRGTCPSGSYKNYGDVDDLVFAVKESAFFVECPSSTSIINKDVAPTSITTNCTLKTSTSFVGTISFSCDASALTGVSCTAPPDLDINEQNSGGEMTIRYVINGSTAVVGGAEELIFAYAHSGGITKSSSFPLRIVSSGGSQMAVYDGTLGAPRCFLRGTECSSGELLDGRGAVGPEPNAPNTIDNCTDGNSGIYHVDEQLDAITVRSGRIDGTGANENIAEGEYATITATVFAFDPNDRADFFYAADAFDPSWVYIGSVQSIVKGGTEVLQIEYRLPRGSNQAVRVKYDYQGNVTTCRETDYGDADDLVFAVASNPFYITCPTERVIFDKEDTPISRELVCTLHTTPDFEGTIQLRCDSSKLTGVSCSTSSPVTIPLGVLQTNLPINVSVSSSAIAGQNGDIVVSGASSNNTTKTAAIPVLIATGLGFHIAEYDAELGAPRCNAAGIECSSGVLLDGRGEVADGPETNQPNTIDNCKDGSMGSYHAHPSIDKLTVRSKDESTGMSEYDTAIISATVWSTLADDLHADFYYTGSPKDPSFSWKYIGTQSTTLEGEPEVFEIEYALPQGTEQAIRVHFRYKDSVNTCPNGPYFNYGDADDLVFVVKASPFSLQCPSDTLRFNKEDIPTSTNVTCFLLIHSNFTGTVDLSCSSSSMTGVNCNTPSSVQVLSGDTVANVTVQLDADTSVVVGEHDSILVSASHETASKKSVINVLISTPGEDQVALYDSDYGAPVCDLSATSCSSADLLIGRGPVFPEPNFPNTIDDCEDGNKGDHHFDESIDRIIVRSGRLNETSADTIREDGYITIIATVWSYDTNDTADFWIARNASTPTWEYIGSVNATTSKALEELKIETMLSAGPTQAIRVNFHYKNNQTLTPCFGGSWDDVDDLVFVVDPREGNTTTASPVPGSQLPTRTPTSLPSTSAPSPSPSTLQPTPSPVSGSSPPTTSPPSTSTPSSSPFTQPPTASPVSGSKPPTISPTRLPTTSPPSSSPSTLPPTPSPVPGSSPPTTSLTNSPITSAPSSSTSTQPPTSSPVYGSQPPTKSPTTSPSTHAPSSIPSSLPPTPSPVPGSSPPTSNPSTSSPTSVPSVVIDMSSSIDWDIACENITDNATFYETAKLFEDAIHETIVPTLHSNQVLRDVSTTTMCGTSLSEPNSIFRRRLAVSSVHFMMEVEEKNSTNAQNLFDQVNGDLNSAVNSGELSTTLQTKGSAANLTVLGNADVQANSTHSNYVNVTSSPTAFPTVAPTPAEGSSDAKWYMNFNVLKCYQDCTGDYPCGGPKEFWNDAYPTLNDCCIINLGTSSPTLTSNCYAGGP